MQPWARPIALAFGLPRCSNRSVPLTRLILLRHGETQWNVEGRYQGQFDSPLTDAGLGQARALAARFVGQTFAALYSSDSGRARQTAEIISSQTRHAVQLHVGLRERNLGEFQGHTRAEVKTRWPEEYCRFRSGEADYAPPGGESNRSLTARITAALAEIAASHSRETIVVVTHGGLLSAFFRHVLELPLDAPRRFARVNASWNCFTVEDGKWMLETWGDTNHLGELNQAR